MSDSLVMNLSFLSLTVDEVCIIVYIVFGPFMHGITQGATFRKILSIVLHLLL
jgi:hypothetical protein